MVRRSFDWLFYALNRVIISPLTTYVSNADMLLLEHLFSAYEVWNVFTILVRAAL
jgi:hypothetical protein